MVFESPLALTKKLEHPPVDFGVKFPQQFVEFQAM
jgi:hypothetical protein